MEPPKEKRVQIRGELAGIGDGVASGRPCLRLLIQDERRDYWAVPVRTNYLLDEGDFITLKHLGQRDWVCLWTPQGLQHSGSTFETLGEPEKIELGPDWEDEPPDFPDSPI